MRYKGPLPFQAFSYSQAREVGEGGHQKLRTNAENNVQQQGRVGGMDNSQASKAAQTSKYSGLSDHISQFLAKKYGH